MRKLIALAPVGLVLTLFGCGGGGGSTLSTTPPPPPPATTNVATLAVDAGPPGLSVTSVNTPFVSVTICAPGSTTNCQTIDHIEVDTASFGLRVMASVLESSVALTQETNSGGDNGPLVECAVFGDGYSWGSVKIANVQVAGEVASNIPIQVIGDPNFPTVPTSCSSMGPTEEDTVNTFGANGILGVGAFVTDDEFYYSCPAGVCAEVTIPANEEVSNPVAYFTTDNNGVIVELPAVAAAGSGPITGSLVFGIDTQTNNALGTRNIFPLDPNLGTISVTYGGTVFGQSYIDSGSNATYFVDSTIPTCSGSTFFCPTATLALSATDDASSSGGSVAVDFSVANAETLFQNNPNGTAFSNLDALNPINNSFDWGLPFFFGVNVYTAIAGSTTSGGAGPFVAF